jgi:hypothetical protein
MHKTYLRPAGLVYGPDARQVVKEGRGASLGGLSTIAYTLVEEIERKGESVSRRFTTGLPGRQTALASFLATDRPLVMGIVNVTPDSFSDGGLNADAERAIANGAQAGGGGRRHSGRRRRIDEAGLRGRSRGRGTPPRDPGDRRRWCRRAMPCPSIRARPGDARGAEGRCPHHERCVGLDP